MKLTSWKILSGTESKPSACQQFLLSVKRQSVKKKRGGQESKLGCHRLYVFIVYTVLLVECNIFTGLYTSENGFT